MGSQARLVVTSRGQGVAGDGQGIAHCPFNVGRALRSGPTAIGIFPSRDTEPPTDISITAAQ
jgi:hypothetical protein